MLTCARSIESIFPAVVVVRSGWDHETAASGGTCPAGQVRLGNRAPTRWVAPNPRVRLKRSHLRDKSPYLRKVHYFKPLKKQPTIPRRRCLEPPASDNETGMENSRNSRNQVAGTTTATKPSHCRTKPTPTSCYAPAPANPPLPNEANSISGHPAPAPYRDCRADPFPKTNTRTTTGRTRQPVLYLELSYRLSEVL